MGVYGSRSEAETAEGHVDGIVRVAVVLGKVDEVDHVRTLMTKLALVCTADAQKHVQLRRLFHLQRGIAKQIIDQQHILGMSARGIVLKGAEDLLTEYHLFILEARAQKSFIQDLGERIH